MNDILQWATVIVIIAIAIVYIAHKIWSKKKNPCSGCSLSDCCQSKNSNNATKISNSPEQMSCKKR